MVREDVAAAVCKTVSFKKKWSFVFSTLRHDSALEICTTRFRALCLLLFSCNSLVEDVQKTFCGLGSGSEARQGILHGKSHHFCWCYGPVSAIHQTSLTTSRWVSVFPTVRWRASWVYSAKIVNFLLFYPIFGRGKYIFLMRVASTALPLPSLCGEG